MDPDALLSGPHWEPSLAELTAELSEFGEDVASSGLRAGLRAASKPIAERMEQLVPVDSGLTRRAINITRAGRGVRARLTAVERENALVIGPNRKVDGRRRAPLAHILEGGSDPHEIRGRLTVRGYRVRIGANVVRGPVRHPGTRATRFMERALDTTGSDQQRLFYEGLERYARRFRANVGRARQRFGVAL